MELNSVHLEGKKLSAYRTGDKTFVFYPELASYFSLTQIPQSTLRRSRRVAPACRTPPFLLPLLKQKGIVANSATHASMVTVQQAQDLLADLRRKGRLPYDELPSSKGHNLESEKHAMTDRGEVEEVEEETGSGQAENSSSPKALTLSPSPRKKITTIAGLP